MHLIYIIILLLGEKQLAMTQPNAHATSSTNLITTSKQLSHYFNQKLKLLSADASAKLKTLSEQILNDTTIQNSETQLIKEFKQNITEYQELYETYKQFGLYDELILIFAATTPSDNKLKQNENSDKRHIHVLLQKFHYNEIMAEFELRFVQFMANDFLPKLRNFENFKQHETQSPTRETFLRWSQGIQECVSYDCYRLYIKQYDNVIFTPKQVFFAYVNRQLHQLNIYYGSNMLRLAKTLNNSSKLDQLKPDLRQKLLLNLNKFINTYHTTEDIQQFYDLQQLFYQTIIKQFYHNNTKNISYEQHQLLKAIFIEAGYAQFQLEYQKKFKDFVDCGVVLEFEKFRASLTTDSDILAEQKLLNWFEHFQSLNSTAEKNNSFDELFEIMKI